jgi:hypothetical protein
VRQTTSDGEVSPIRVVTFTVPTADGGNNGGTDQNGTDNNGGGTDNNGGGTDQGGGGTDQNGGGDDTTDNGGGKKPVKPVISFRYKNDKRPKGTSLRGRTHLVLVSNVKVKVTGKLVISKKLAKKLHLRSRTVATAKGTGSGKRVLANIKYNAKAKKALSTYRGKIKMNVTVKAKGAKTIKGTFTLKAAPKKTKR